MTATPPSDYQRLASVARARRAELGLAITAVAERAGMSKDTYKRLERGLRIWDSKYAQIDTAFEWATGSCLAILDGGEPIPIADVEGAPTVQKSPIPPELIDREAQDVVQLALIATAKGTTVEEIRDMSERVVRDLRERGLI